MLLADFESFIAGAFMVIAFVGWVVNLVSQNKPGAAPNRRGPGPRPAQQPKSIQSEIDKFLDQARPANATPPKREERLSSDGVEVIERPRNQPPRRPPPTEQRRRTREQVWEEQTRKPVPSAPAPQAKKQPPAPQRKPGNAKAARSGDAIVDRHLATPAQRRESAADNRISNSVSKDMAPQIATNVTSHLGVFAAGAANSTGERAMAGTTEMTESAAVRLARLMRSRHGVRDAILLSEIMSRPRALRRNST